MVGKFLGVQVPAVGFSIGFERVCGILLEQPSHYLSLFVSILIFLNPFYYRAGCDEQQHIYSRYKIR